MFSLAQKLLNRSIISATILLSASAAISAEKPTLTVYSYDSFTSDWGPGPKLKQTFEQQCQCALTFVPFEDGVTMLNRLYLEKGGKADVLIGLDNNQLANARQSSLFAENNVDLSQLTLPIAWQDRTFMPYDYGQYAFIYDQQKLKNPPTSLKALVERQDLKVIYQDPRTSTVGRGLLAWINTVYPQDQVENAWKTLAKHTVTVGKGWSETYGAFLKGESDMVLSYNTSPLYHQIHEQKDNYAAAEFEEGHIVQIELAAKLKKSQQPELAEQFLAFLLSPEAQKTIALHNIMLPVIKTEVEPRFDQFTPFKTLAIPFPSSDDSKAQIQVWQQALSQ
ncbi:thiamine ABC transporter substrate binding subunit [Testudinibacter sp. TR-2022]|uniref:thiamine ABC transporter substrate binding subunit n=1 Tax=Testudinibacter sp. TR-2022 TaxID=2585029 RepID=UPI00111AE552|nr:thiamine ABC transporter substrate binding subunit [Testudinibacter sp. TR-2022]TNH05384.1 thiamine ABC transporter substrate binding subunit [Pasteurellaceae bacterium Phil31]TNH09927.1 thiamine ABC transporter substrate binding subunit [Testudinibacter sp. TR-2022]TNH12187.1 thiamine ABC transporter substrate binding subunit [Testudinibacter sp. TR-2022]TNH14815.1 thiamine ABC transporter substrate binding subunit [Testudinibacter sp. TR-2022]TNH15451.1 thiamine ABC transporter substrate 